MKKQWIIFAVCLLAAAVMCLAVSMPGPAKGYFFTTGPTGSPPLPTHGVGPTGPNNGTIDSTPTLDTEPVITPTEVRLYICGKENAAKYEALAQEYMAVTGISCQILTGDLNTLMQSDVKPTIFCVHSERQAKKWQDQMLDLTDQPILQQLYNPAFALKLNGKTAGLAMNVTAHGIVYNAALLGMTGYTRADITDWASFRQVVEATTAMGKSLGFQAFAHPDPRTTYFAAMVSGVQLPQQQLRQLMDLIRANQKNYESEMDAFVSGKTVFYIGGAWEFAEFSQLGFHNLDFLPFYDETGGSFPCICDTYWAVHSGSSQGDIQAALDFMQWLVTATENAAPVDSLDLIAPFWDADAGDLFVRRIIRKYIATEPVTVRWSLAGDVGKAPLQTLTDCLEAYFQNPSDENWNAVVKALS